MSSSSHPVKDTLPDPLETVDWTSLASLVVYMWERTGQAELTSSQSSHCTAVNFSQHSATSHSLSPQSITAMADIVKSSYVVDPDDQMRLIRRDDVGTEIDREYWDRVNQEQIFLRFLF